MLLLPWSFSICLLIVTGSGIVRSIAIAVLRRCGCSLLEAATMGLKVKAVPRRKNLFRNQAWSK
uniref:Uncharacterized protein n=1 Tax=Rhizophora mucronata TaxID=61149 RepID=A0A2P2P6C6_RHIMU